jgi:putative endonuclease
VNAPERRRARGFGLEAEFLARVYLRATGWRILDFSYMAPGGEIDIVARRRDLVAFVEVKARETRDAALLSIDAPKQRRISRAARHWLVRNSLHQDCNFRGDAILITPWRLPERVEAAFVLDLGNA